MGINLILFATINNVLVHRSSSTWANIYIGQIPRSGILVEINTLLVVKCIIEKLFTKCNNLHFQDNVSQRHNADIPCGNIFLL